MEIVMQYKRHDNVLLRAEEPVLFVEMFNGTKWVPYPENDTTPWTTAWFEGTPVKFEDPTSAVTKEVHGPSAGVVKDAAAVTGTTSQKMFERAAMLKQIGTRTLAEHESDQID